MTISAKDLFDANVHLGHQTRRWNPKTKHFIYGIQNGTTLIDLEKTERYLKEACAFVENLVAAGKTILFLGTKKPAQEMLREAAQSVQMPSCVSRWMGGNFTNFSTIKRSLEKYKRYLAMDQDGSLAKLPKKELAVIRREMERMNRNFEGMLELNKLPDAVFVVDVHKEAIAVAEAKRLGLPVIGIVDTNANPEGVTHPIPANDDAVSSLRLLIETITEAVQRGHDLRQMKLQTVRVLDHDEAQSQVTESEQSTVAQATEAV